jgi:hypothetical protein
MAPASEERGKGPGSDEPQPPGASGSASEPPRPSPRLQSLHAAAELAVQRVHERVGRSAAAVRHRDAGPFFGGAATDPAVPSDPDLPSDPDARSELGPPHAPEPRAASEVHPEPEGPPERSRVVVRELVVRHGGARVHVVATLRLGERSGRGTAEMSDTRSGLWRGIGEATLAALDDLVGSPLLVGIDRITVASREEPPTVRVLLTADLGAGEETLIGASLLHDDPGLAVMRATLDALNARIEPLPGRAEAAAAAS